MNTKQAIDILINKAHRFRLVEKINRNKFLCYCIVDKQTEEYTGRELISLARAYTSDNNQTTSFKKKLKDANKEKNRAKLKQIIHNEEWDKLSSKEEIFKEDEWSHS